MTRPDDGHESVHRLLAPAKLTWTLEVTGRRANGYHEIRSEMVSLDLCDELAIVESDATAVVYEETDDPRLRVVAPRGHDLIEKALALATRTATVVVRKRVPVGGGLGGGSSDAGAILRWAGFGDLALAATLGGDVPFCVHGGRADVRGIGETVRALTYEHRTVTLVIPPFGVDTGACYRAFDEMDDAPPVSARNDLREAACRVEPRLRTALEWLAAETGQPVELCGSGSTMFFDAPLSTSTSSWSLTSPVGELRCHVASTTPAQ